MVLCQTFVLLKQPQRHFAFLVAHELRHRIFRRYLHYQMDMIRLDVQLQYEYLILLLTQLIHLLPEIFDDRIFEDPIPIIRAKYNMVLALI